jgi:adenylate cyclase
VKPRHLLAAAIAAVGVSALFTLMPLGGMQGLSLDLLFWLRHQAFGPRHAPASSPTVVIAIDEETYRRPPFADTPQVMWTPQIAAVMEAALAAGARVVGFDVIYPTSVEPFLRGYERDFLLALRRGAEQGRVVLGRVQHQVRPITPFRGYSFAVGHGRNIRPLNLIEDDDGIIRRLPLYFTAQGQDGRVEREPSLAVELAARALGRKPEWIGDGLRLGDYAVPSGGGAMTINFDSGPGDIPAYSLADLFACVEAGRADYFRRHFEGRVVLFGAVLDVEDRKLTAKRLVTAPEGLGLPERCSLPVMGGLYRTDIRRDTIPGVYVHAAAVNNLLRGEALAGVAALPGFLLVLVVAGAVAAAAMRFAPLLAGGLSLAAALAWTAAATFAFRQGLVLPLLDGLAAGAAVLPLLLGYRFAVTDRDRRQLGRAFALYLPPAVIDRLMAGNRPPALGGEERAVSILFSDIADFTRISERRDPTLLVQDLNEYFAAMTAIVEEHGGFVDKFIGDAVLAVFGAPLDDAGHALHAVQAAMRMRETLAAGGERFRFGGERPIGVRIGVNSGTALIGNIGSPRRFNYTVMGDAVNLASRIEGANKRYGSAILVSDESRAACADRILFREVDRVRVVGRDQPVSLHEPLAAADAAEPALRGRVEAFAAALALWRAGRFAAAAAAFAALAAADPVAAAFAARAQGFVAAPPAGWDGTTDLKEK